MRRTPADPATGGGAEAQTRAGRALRFETGVPNLDQVLGGGLLRGTIVMVIGPPGSGKTILAQQLAFAATRRGEVVLYFTGYSETNGFLVDDQAAAHFLYSLGAKLALLGATLLVLVEGDATDRIRDPEQSVCDVILSLTRVVRGGGHRRQLEVLKVRGAAPLAGVHPFVIDGDGVYI